jgi:glycerol-3-phosphate acyltransferase PlsY
MIASPWWRPWPTARSTSSVRCTRRRTRNRSACPSRPRQAGPWGWKPCCLPRCGSIMRDRSRCHLIAAMSLNPARRFGLPGGRFTPGAPADLVLFDPGRALPARPVHAEVEVQEHALRRCAPARAGLGHLGGWRACLRRRGGHRMIPRSPRGSGRSSGVAVAAYLLGSVPFGIVMARLFGLGDLRQIGSGNIGATNVLQDGQQDGGRADAHPRRRQGRHRRPGRARAGRRGCRTGGGPRGILRPLLSGVPGFRGGKGVATFLGTLLALFWPAGVAACLTWLLVAAVSRYSSLSALVAAVLSPLWAAFLGRPRRCFSACILAALILWRHRENIRG